MADRQNPVARERRSHQRVYHLAEYYVVDIIFRKKGNKLTREQIYANKELIELTRLNIMLRREILKWKR